MNKCSYSVLWFEHRKEIPVLLTSLGSYKTHRADIRAWKNRKKSKRFHLRVWYSFVSCQGHGLIIYLFIFFRAERLDQRPFQRALEQGVLQRPHTEEAPQWSQTLLWVKLGDGEEDQKCPGQNVGKLFGLTMSIAGG